MSHANIEFSLTGSVGNRARVCMAGFSNRVKVSGNRVGLEIG